MRTPTVAFVLLAACGPTPPQITAPVAEFQTSSAVPTTGPALTQTAVDVGASVERLGISRAGNLVVRTPSGTWEFVAGALEKRTLYAPQGELTSLGAVTAITPRLAGGAWLTAGNGLFALEGLYVTRSPMNPGTLFATVEQPRGPLEGLWLATADGLIRKKGDDTQRFTLAGVAPNVTQLAVEPNGKALIAAMDGRVFVFLPDGTGVTSVRAPARTGTPRAVVAAPDALFAATDTGLWRYSVSAEKDPWTRLMLSSHVDPLLLSALAADPVTGTVWGRADGQLIRLEKDAATAFTVDAAMQGFAVDLLGDLWLPNGAKLLRLKAAEAKPVSFATGLKPWLQQHCTVCHADFAEAAPFALKAEAALFRVSTGDMPRCTGGVPCPANQRLTDTTLLEQWIRTGKEP